MISYVMPNPLISLCLNHKSNVVTLLEISLLSNSTSSSLEQTLENVVLIVIIGQYYSMSFGTIFPSLSSPG